MYYFALSLVVKLNRFNPRNQLRAQIHILNFLVDIGLEDENQCLQATQASLCSHVPSPNKQQDFSKSTLPPPAMKYRHII